MIFTSKQIKTQILLVLVLLLVVTINSSCISLTKSLKEKSPLIIEMDTDKHLGKFTEYGISKNMVSVVYFNLDIVSAFSLSMTNRSFYCLFNEQLDWVKFYYYTNICCRLKSDGKKFDKQLLRKILSLSLTNQDHIYFPRALVNCHRYLRHTSIYKTSPPLELKWQHSPHFFSSKTSDSTLCPFKDAQSECSSFCSFDEELIVCTKMMSNHLNYIGHHTHFIIQNVKIPTLYVFAHVHNSYDEIIFFDQTCSFERCDQFSETITHEISSKNRKDTLYFYLTNRESDKCFMCIELTKSLNTQCQILGIVSKKNPKQEYKLKSLFYLPSISFSGKD